MSLGKVYEIVCNQTGERYVGSTKLKMCLRKALHKMKTNGCKSKQIIDRNDYVITILEDNVPADILRKTEQAWQDKQECVNVRNAYVSPEDQKEHQRLKSEEWYKKPENKASKKARYELNKEVVLAKAKVMYHQKKPEVLAKRAVYYETNKDNIRAYQAEYRKKQKQLKANKT